MTWGNTTHPISLYGYCSFPPRHAVLKATIVRKSQSLLEAEGWTLVKIGSLVFIFTDKVSHSKTC